MWKEDELFICESNAKTGYWPINGIQCNPYEGTFHLIFCNAISVICLEDETLKLYEY